MPSIHQLDPAFTPPFIPSGWRKLRNGVIVTKRDRVWLFGKWCECDPSPGHRTFAAYVYARRSRPKA